MTDERFFVVSCQNWKILQNISLMIVLKDLQGVELNSAPCKLKKRNILDDLYDFQDFRFFGRFPKSKAIFAGKKGT